MSEKQWTLCSICGNKTRTMKREDTERTNSPRYCPKRQRETIININANAMKITLADYK